jgi:hypothetical protein
VVGGFLYNLLWPAGGVVTEGEVLITGIDVAATAIGAFVGSVLLVNIYGLVAGRPKGQPAP